MAAPTAIAASTLANRFMGTSVLVQWPTIRTWQAVSVINPAFGNLQPTLALDRPDLFAPAALAAVQQWLPDALVAEIDPDVSDTEAMCARYGVPLEASANVVLITGKRAGGCGSPAGAATHRMT